MQSDASLRGLTQRPWRAENERVIEALRNAKHLCSNPAGRCARTQNRTSHVWLSIPRCRFSHQHCSKRAAPVPEVGAKCYARQRNNLPVAIRINKGESSWRDSAASSDQVRGKRNIGRRIDRNYSCFRVSFPWNKNRGPSFGRNGRFCAEALEEALRRGLKHLAGQYGTPLKWRGGQGNSVSCWIDGNNSAVTVVFL